MDEVGAFGLCEELAIGGVGVEVVEEVVELGEGGGGAVEDDCVRGLLVVGSGRILVPRVSDDPRRALSVQGMRISPLEGEAVMVKAQGERMRDCLGVRRVRRPRWRSWAMMYPTVAGPVAHRNAWTGYRVMNP